MEWSAIHQLLSGLTAEECPFEIFIMGAGASSADADWGLRPIFMTVMTTFFGQLMLVVRGGSGAELYRGVGAVTGLIGVVCQ